MRAPPLLAPVAGFVFSWCEEPRCELNTRTPCGSASLCPAAAVMLFANGMTQAMIANMFGCSQNAVSHALRKRNVSTRRGPRPDIAKRERAVGMAGAGKSYYEIADVLQVSHATVSKWARAAGIVRGKGGGCVVRNNARRNAETRQRIESAIGDRFEVVDVGTSMWSALRCRACGTEFRRKVDPRYPTTCPECHRREVEARTEARERPRLMSRLARAVAHVAELKARQERERELLDAKHVCKECGREFTLRELRESNPWNYTIKPTFCSRECSRKWNRRLSRHRRRERMKDGDGVSLPRLIDRDNNRCWICGGDCDKGDYSYEDGVFIAGPSYPSVDHVVPLSMGGKNDPSNARLAHFRCNSLRGTGGVDEVRQRL